MAIPERSRPTVVRVSKTAELIADQLRVRIAHGALKPDDTLPPEPELIKQFNVSRPTLREAFRILENESLIEIRRGSRGGVVVKAPRISGVARNLGLILQMSGVTIADVYTAGTALECVAAGMLAKRRKRADLRDLQQKLAVLELLVEDKDTTLTQWAEASLQFHDAIATRSGNATLQLLLIIVREIVDMHMSHLPISETDASVRRHNTKMLSSYKGLVALIEEGDDAAVQTFWRRETQKAAAGKLMGWLAADTAIDVFSEAPVLRKLTSPVRPRPPR